MSAAEADDVELRNKQRTVNSVWDIDIMNDPKLDQLIAESDIQVPQEAVEEEAKMLAMEWLHQQQYEALRTGDYSYMYQSREDRQEEFQAQALRRLQIQRLVDGVITRKSIQITQEELEEEAQAMAKRMDIGMDMVRSFFGDDFGMLKRDLQERKALDFLCRS